MSVFLRRLWSLLRWIHRNPHWQIDISQAVADKCLHPLGSQRTRHAPPNGEPETQQHSCPSLMRNSFILRKMQKIREDSLKYCFFFCRAFLLSCTAFMSCQNSSFSTVKTAQSASQPTDTTFASANPTGFKNRSIKIRTPWARWSWSPSKLPGRCVQKKQENQQKNVDNVDTSSESNPVCQVFSIAASALDFHLRVPFDAVGIGQDDPPLGIDHETGTAGTVLPSPLPRQRKVRGAVDAPNLSSSSEDAARKFQVGKFSSPSTLVKSNWNHWSKLSNTAKFACSSIETLTTESNGTPKPSSPSSSSSQSQAPKASSSSLPSGLPTGRRPFFLVPSLLPLRTGVSSACPAPSRSRLRTMAAGREDGPFANEEFSSILRSIQPILSCLSCTCSVFGWRSRSICLVVGGGRLFCVPCFYLLLKSDLRRNRTHAGTICDNSLKPGPQSRIAFFQVFQKSKQTWVPQPCPSGYMPEQVFIFLNDPKCLFLIYYSILCNDSSKYSPAHINPQGKNIFSL